MRPPSIQTLVVAAAAFLCSACGAASGDPLCRELSASPDPLDRGPIVSAVSASSAVVSWHDVPADPHLAEYRAAGGAWRATSTSASGVDGRVDLVGLRPSTSYEYRLEDQIDGDTLEGSFRTAPDLGQGAVRFAVLGDSGSGCEAELAVSRELASVEPDLVLHTGDVLYSKNAADLEPFFFQPFGPVLAHVPFFLAVGNHDVDTALLESIEMPVNDADGTERFYSFDWGPAHFVALDSNLALGPSSAQRAWLEGDLATTRQPWRIVYFHHPPYSSARGGRPALRHSLEPLFARYDVDLVFNGHDHDYERTYPMRDDHVVDLAQDPHYVDPQGTIYVVTGGGGRSLYPSGTSDFTAYSESSYHVTRVAIDGDTLSLSALRTDGTTLDEMTLTKPELDAS